MLLCEMTFKKQIYSYDLKKPNQRLQTDTENEAADFDENQKCSICRWKSEKTVSIIKTKQKKPWYLSHVVTGVTSILCNLNLLKARDRTGVWRWWKLEAEYLKE